MMAAAMSSAGGEGGAAKRLYRSREHRILAGVCGGLADYFGADVALIRLAFVLFTLVGGAGMLGYSILWIAVPRQPSQPTPALAPESRGKAVWGVALIIVGIILLTAWPRWCSAAFPVVFLTLLAPGLLLALGLGLILGWLLTKSRRQNAAAPRAPGERLYRARDSRVVAGICGGLGRYFNLDPTLVRVLWVLFAIASLGIALLLYVLLIIIVPEEPLS